MVTLHMYSADGEIGSATVSHGMVEPGGDPIITRAIETSVQAMGWPPEDAVRALDGQSNGYWVYSTSGRNPYDTMRSVKAQGAEEVA